MIKNKKERKTMNFKNVEDLYWWRVKNLWKIYQSITDDLVYQAMWERKLKELMQRGFDGQ